SVAALASSVARTMVRMRMFPSLWSARTEARPVTIASPAMGLAAARRYRHRPHPSMRWRTVRRAAGRQYACGEVRPPGASRTRPCVASREPRQGRAPRGSDLARVPQPPTCIVRSGAPGPVVGDKRVGMAVAELVLGLEEGNLFGMLPVAPCIQQFEPVGDRLAVG